MVYNHGNALFIFYNVDLNVIELQSNWKYTNYTITLSLLSWTPTEISIGAAGSPSNMVWVALRWVCWTPFADDRVRY